MRNRLNLCLSAGLGIIAVCLWAGCAAWGAASGEAGGRTISTSSQDARIAGVFVAAYQIQPQQVTCGAEQIELAEAWAEKRQSIDNRGQVIDEHGYNIVVRLKNPTKNRYRFCPTTNACSAQFVRYMTGGFAVESVLDRVEVELFSVPDAERSEGIVLTRITGRSEKDTSQQLPTAPKR